MPVTDDQVATLRALLSNDIDRYRRLFAGLERGEAAKGYSALITAGFSEAALRRFGSDYAQADIVTFVGSLRARSAAVSEAVDPDAAELLLNAALGDASTRGMSREAKVNTQISLMVGLIADEHLDDAGLDAFLADARKLADQILGEQGSPCSPSLGQRTANPAFGGFVVRIFPLMLSRSSPAEQSSRSSFPQASHGEACRRGRRDRGRKRPGTVLSAC